MPTLCGLRTELCLDKGYMAGRWKGTLDPRLHVQGILKCKDFKDVWPVRTQAVLLSSGWVI